MLYGLARKTLDLVLPPLCACCDAPVAAPGQLCAACFGGFVFITEPLCRRCGVPFPSTLEAGTARLCARCLRVPPAWGQARAALLYDAQAKSLILPLKHTDRGESVAVLALHMQRAGAGLLARAEALVPVPLHRRRLLQRRYNQAAFLAHALGRRTGLPVLADALQRRHPTAPLGGLNAVERRAVLEGAIVARPSRMARVRGRRLLLIDDVMTSGATAAACAVALLDAGASHIDVLVASRVPAPAARDDYLEPDTEDADD